MIKTNKDKLLITEILGEITHPALAMEMAYTTTWNGKSKLGIGMGSIKYNVKIGDPCFGWAEGENVEPGVAVDSIQKEPGQSIMEENAFRILACIGNEAVVVSGDAKGAKGVVVGKHGYIPRGEGLRGGHHVLISFEDSDLEKLVIGDKVLVKSRGVGLEIEGFQNVKVLNIDPELLERIVEIEDGKLVVPVVMEVPAYIMGQGSGGMPAETSSYEIQTSSPVDVEELGLKRLRLGDIVACKDILTAWGRGYYKGAVTIGVVSCGSSDLAGHGIGLTSILTCKEKRIMHKLDPKANIGYCLGILK
ncbi:MAG: DUF4438 domain-containing protein [Candidatus Bathyarchaeia archaeon]